MTEQEKMFWDDEYIDFSYSLSEVISKAEKLVKETEKENDTEGTD